MQKFNFYDELSVKWKKSEVSQRAFSTENLIYVRNLKMTLIQDILAPLNMSKLNGLGLLDPKIWSGLRLVNPYSFRISKPSNYFKP